MNKIFLSILIGFLAYVRIPMGLDKRYAVESFFAKDAYYCLTLTDKTTVYVPIMFTVIEER